MANVANFTNNFDVNIIAIHCDELAKFNDPITKNELTTEQRLMLGQILQDAWKGGNPQTRTSDEFKQFIGKEYEQMVRNNVVVITDRHIVYGGTTLTKVNAARNRFEQIGTASPITRSQLLAPKSHTTEERETLAPQPWTLGKNNPLMQGSPVEIKQAVTKYHDEAPKKVYAPLLPKISKFSEDFYKSKNPKDVDRKILDIEKQEKIIIHDMRNPNGEWKANERNGVINYQMWPMRMREFFGVYQDTYPMKLRDINADNPQKFVKVREHIKAEMKELIAQHIAEPKTREKTLEMLEKFMDRYEGCHFDLANGLSAVEIYTFYRTIGMYMIWQTVTDHRTMPGSIHDINHSHANDTHADECADGLHEEDKAPALDFLMTFTNLFHDMAYIEPAAVNHESWFHVAGDHPMHSALSLYQNRNFFEKFIPAKLLELSEDTIATHGLPTGRGATVGEFNHEKDEFGINRRHFMHVFRACDECATSYKEKSCRVMKVPKVLSNILRTQIYRTHLAGKNEDRFAEQNNLYHIERINNEVKTSIKQAVFSEGVMSTSEFSEVQAEAINSAIEQQYSATTQKTALEQIGGDLSHLELEYTGAFLGDSQKYRIKAFMNLCHTTGMIVGLSPAGVKDTPVFWNSIGKFYKDVGGDTKALEANMRQMRRDIIEGNAPAPVVCRGEFGDVVVEPEFVELDKELSEIFHFLEYHSLLPAIGDMEFDLTQEANKLAAKPNDLIKAKPPHADGAPITIVNLIEGSFEKNITNHMRRIGFKDQEKIDKLNEVKEKYLTILDTSPRLTGKQASDLLTNYMKEIRTVDVMTKEEAEFVRSGKITK